jgi:hypothetical protein
MFHVGDFNTDEARWSLDDPWLVAEHGKAEPGVVVNALSGLAFNFGVSRMEELSPRVIWGGKVNGLDAALVRAKLRSGGEFGIIGVGPNVQSWMVPRDAADFPAVWRDFEYQRIVNVLAGPEVVRAEFRANGDVVFAGDAKPYRLNQFEMPADSPDMMFYGTVALYDARGKVRWTGRLNDLPGPDFWNK